MNTKTYKVAGTAVKNSVTKFRVAQALNRSKALEKDGQTDVKLIELPKPMNIVDAARYCLTHEAFVDLKHQIAINSAIEKEKATKATAKTKKEPIVTPVVEAKIKPKATTKPKANPKVKEPEVEPVVEPTIEVIIPLVSLKPKPRARAKAKVKELH